ncbi:MAG: hypothetical protein QXE51_06210, partial [Nitrososphaeria archaeon]
NGSTVCIEPGNYSTNLIINGSNITLNQICKGQVNVPQVGFYGSGQVNNLQLQANSSAGTWGAYSFNSSDITIQNGDINSSGISLSSSSMKVAGNVSSSGPIYLTQSFMSAGGDINGTVANVSDPFTQLNCTNAGVCIDNNSTMTAGGNITCSGFTCGISPNDNSTMTAGGNIISYGWGIGAGNHSTMTAGGNIIAADWQTNMGATNSTIEACGNIVDNGWFRDLRGSSAFIMRAQIFCFGTWPCYYPTTNLGYNNSWLYPPPSFCTGQ